MLQTYDSSEATLTEAFASRFRKGRVQKIGRDTAINQRLSKQLTQMHEDIYRDYDKLNGLISALDKHFVSRLQIHEHELLKIAHHEINSMQKECEKAVQKYKKLIQDKNINLEIERLMVDLAKEKQIIGVICEQNLALKLEVSSLRKDLTELKYRLSTEKHLVRRITKKLTRERSHQPESFPSLIRNQQYEKQQTSAETPLIKQVSCQVSPGQYRTDSKITVANQSTDDPSKLPLCKGKLQKQLSTRSINKPNKAIIVRNKRFLTDWRKI